MLGCSLNSEKYNLMLRCQDNRVPGIRLEEGLCVGCVWDSRFSNLKVEGVQVSVTQCLGVLVCTAPIIDDLRLQFCHDMCNICLYSSELQFSAVKVICAAGVGGSRTALPGSPAMARNMFTLP